MADDIKTELFYSINRERLSKWLEKNRGKVEIIGLYERPYENSGEMSSEVMEITVFYREQKWHK